MLNVAWRASGFMLEQTSWGRLMWLKKDLTSETSLSIWETITDQAKYMSTYEKTCALLKGQMDSSLSLKVH